MPVHKLQRTATVYKKKNTYTLYVTKEKPYKPVRYVLHGYDTLLHSFYDHYVVDYLSFHEWDFDFNVMKIPTGMQKTICKEDVFSKNGNITKKKNPRLRKKNTAWFRTLN